ncbi:MAG: FecR domain-containing protein [Pirellulales bacterium]|nr:FecR domain-containing protein [Pirellulales bacterium]
MNDGSETRMTDADVVALVERYLDGDLTAEQQSTLFDRLRLDERARTLFVHTITRAAYLSELLAQQRSANVEPVSRSDSPRSGETRGCPVVDLSSPNPVDLPAPDSPSGTSFGWVEMRGWLTGWGGLVLIVVAVTAACGLFWMGRDRGAELANRPAPSGAAPNASSRGAIQEVFDPRSIYLAAGSVRLTLPKVGYMLVDGPADVDLVTPLRARLNRGRIRVRVTEKSGRGFVVETPDGEIVDLSTEFGIDVKEGKNSGIVVFDGAVDLHLGKSAANEMGRIERLIGGEGVTFDKAGKVDRVVSIVTGNVATYLPDDEATPRPRDTVITKVTDNLRNEDTKKFYEIVPGGLGEDVLAYADRPMHEWNGLTRDGIPKFLIGADYVKTFSDDDLRSDVTINVWLSRPAKLYVFFDKNLKPPQWLESGFRMTDQVMGIDLGPWPEIGRTVRRGVGPGECIDHSFRIWERVVKEPGIVTLGGNGTYNAVRRCPERSPYMYGIAAVPLYLEKTRSKTTRKEKTLLKEQPITSY